MQETTCAYIAGFLDGDGSLMFQLKPRSDYVYGFQIKVTLAFYQKRSNRSILEWLKDNLEVGAIRDRNDGISEYDIEGFVSVQQVLKQIYPYVILKRKQVDRALQLIAEIANQPEPTPEQFLGWCAKVESFQTLNYTKKRKHTLTSVKTFLVSKGYL
ncbi:MAG: hypothetical protein Fur0043_27330 [Anaerolineales bacterium]